MDSLQYDYLVFLTERIRERIQDDETLMYVNKLSEVIDVIHGDTSHGATPQRTTSRRTSRRSTSPDNKKDAD